MRWAKLIFLILVFNDSRVIVSQNKSCVKVQIFILRGTSEEKTENPKHSEAKNLYEIQYVLTLKQVINNLLSK